MKNWMLRGEKSLMKFRFLKYQEETHSQKKKLSRGHSQSMIPIYKRWEMIAKKREDWLRVK
jgi:hypothetical protein